jgi:predicted N-acetyltransferase YhbS
VCLRIAEPLDLEAVTSVINLAFKVERFFIERDRISADDVCTLAGKGKFLVAEDLGKVVGCVYVELRGASAYLGLLAVHPSRQRSGLGSQLMQGAEDYCRDAGCQSVDLRIVNLRAELPAFYRRRGYRENGTSPFPAEARAKQPCHFVNMTKSLVQASEAGR